MFVMIVEKKNAKNAVIDLMNVKSVRIGVVGIVWRMLSVCRVNNFVNF